MIQKELAVVLRSVATGERDRVVTAITERTGIVAGLARNAIQSRRFGGTLELFTAAEWSFVAKPGADLVSIREAQIKRGFEGLRRDLNSLGLAGAFSEILLKLVQPGTPVPELFKLHSNALAYLEEQGPSLGLLAAYLCKVLSWSGHQPRWFGCLSCARTLEEIWRTARSEGPEGTNSDLPWLACRIPEAGWLCPKCRATAQGLTHVQVENAGTRLSLHAAAEAAARLHLPIRQAVAALQLPEDDMHELVAFLQALLVYHVPGFDRQPLRSLQLVRL